MERKYDVVIKGANIFSIGSYIDIGIKDGKIIDLMPGIEISDEEATVINATNKILIPGFVDSHMHIDKAFIPTGNCDGLYDAIEASSKYLSSIPENEIICNIQERASKVIELAISHGSTAIKTHVLVHEALPLWKMKSLTAIIELKRKYKDYIDIFTIVPFYPYVDKEFEELVASAAQRGYPDVRDSIYINCTTEEKIDCIFEFAEKYNLNIDLHVDESDNPDIECFKYVIRKAKDKKWNGNVTCGHVTALSAIGFPDDEANKAIIDSVQENINIITLSSCNLYLMSSNRRGVTRVREFLKAGSNISFASDNVRDPFRPFGNANMLEEALITAQINKFGNEEQLNEVMKMGTFNPAKNCAMENYGVSVGCFADLVILDSESAHNAILSQSKVLYAFKRGKLTVKDGKILW